MVIKLNRDRKQSFKEIENEFPNSRFLAILDAPEDNEGHLLAVSDSEDTDVELCNLMKEYSNDTDFCVGGFYEDSMAVGVLSFAREEQI